jgi:hypothetical protein
MLESKQIPQRVGRQTTVELFFSHIKGTRGLSVFHITTQDRPLNGGSKVLEVVSVTENKQHSSPDTLVLALEKKVLQRC